MNTRRNSENFWFTALNKNGGEENKTKKHGASSEEVGCLHAIKIYSLSVHSSCVNYTHKKNECIHCNTTFASVMMWPLCKYDLKQIKLTIVLELFRCYYYCACCSNHDTDNARVGFVDTFLVSFVCIRGILDGTFFYCYAMSFKLMIAMQFVYAMQVQKRWLTEPTMDVRVHLKILIISMELHVMN